MKKKDPIQKKMTRKAASSLKASKSLFSNKQLLESTKSMLSHLSEIPFDLIANKTLKASNSLINLFEGTLKEFDIYIIDFKCFRLSKDNINKILDEVKKTPINISDKFLIKVGYCYDKEREMLSVLYYKGKAVPFDFEVIKIRRQSDNIDEDRIKLCLINNFLSLYKDPQQLMMNNIFHPSLLFFLDKQGLMFFDNIIGIIFNHCRECITPIYLPYFGYFDTIRAQNHQVYILLCLFVFFFSNNFSEANSKKSTTTSYDEIVYRMKIDLINQRKDLDTVFKNMTKEKYTKFKTMISYSDLNAEGALNNIFKSFKLFYEQLIEPASCDICKITSHQIESCMFTIHYPCYNILCNKCLPSHDCKLAVLKELEMKEHQLLEEKAISVLLSKKEKMTYSQEYEKIASLLYGDFYTSLFKKVGIEQVNEKVVDHLVMIISNEQKDSFKKLKKEYKDLSESPSFLYDNFEVLQLNHLLSQMEDKSQLVNQFTQIFLLHGSDLLYQIETIKTQFNEICSMLKKDIFKQLDELVSILYQRCKTFLVRYSFQTLIEEFDMNSYYTKLSIYIRKTNTVHWYDLVTSNKGELSCPYHIPMNSSSINLKSMFVITGGHGSKATYALTYSKEMNKNSFCQLADMTLFHMFHSMIKVGFSYIYCISGSTTAKNEYYNIFTNEWMPLSAELPRPYANSSLFLYNQIDLYIFFGELKEKKALKPSYDILMLELFVDNAQWEKINFIPPEDYISVSLCGIVQLNESNILLVGGLRMNKNNEINESTDIYLFNLNTLTIKKEEQKLGDSKGISFSNGNFYEISKETVATWGDNQKLIKMNRYLGN